MISLLAFLFVFGILVFIHELGHFLFAKKNGVRVEKFSFGFGPKLFGKKVGDTEYLVSAVPLGGYIKMAGDEPGQDREGKPWEFLSRTCGQRAQIVTAGPVLNYILAFLLFSFIFIAGSPTLTTRVGKVLDDFPAKETRIKEDDIILAVDGEKVEYWLDMAEIIHQKTSGEIILDIKRKDRVFKVKVTPKIQEREDIFGQKIKIGLIGISPSEELTEIKYGWGESLYKGGEKLLTLSGFTYKALWFILIRRISLKESLTGPIGIFYFTGRAAKLGFIYLLNLMGLLSMSLAIFNFLPVPVLDGGHLFFLLLEKLRKKPVNVKAQELATKAGMLLLVLLMIFVLYNDLVRFGVWDKASDWLNRMGQGP